MSRTLRYSGAIALVPLLTLAAILGVQALRAAEAPVRQAANPDAAKIAALEKRVAQLETQLKALETKTKLIASDGLSSFTVNAPGSVTLNGGGLKVTAGIITISSGQTTVSANGHLGLNSALVTINNGGKPAARQGDAVMISGPGTGQVAIGSPTVLIGN